MVFWMVNDYFDYFLKRNENEDFIGIYETVTEKICFGIWGTTND